MTSEFEIAVGILLLKITSANASKSISCGMMVGGHSSVSAGDLKAVKHISTRGDRRIINITPRPM
jgi:hypothetical protein